MIIGLSSLITVFGQIVGPLLAGIFADWTGNYRLGFTILAVMVGLGSLFFILAKPPKPPGSKGPTLTDQTETGIRPAAP